MTSPHTASRTSTVAAPPDALPPGEWTVGQLATTRPASLRVLHRHGIDFCCGGGRAVRDACAKAGVSVDALEAEIAALEAQAPATTDWATAPLSALIDHILATHHRPLDQELPRLLAMAERVVQVHGDKMPEVLPAILGTLREMIAEIGPHMQKEEVILFPWIVQGRGAQCMGPVSVMETDHEVLGELLVRMAGLTQAYTPPDGACGTWRGLYQGLGELDADLRLHIHLENNVLFPRALRGEA